MFPHPYPFRWGHPHGKEWPKGLQRHSPLSKTPTEVDKALGELRNDLGEQGKFTKKKTSALVLFCGAFFRQLFFFESQSFRGMNFKKPSVFHTRNRGFGQPANPCWSPWILFWGTKPYKNRLPTKSQKGNKHQNHQTSSKVSFHFWPSFRDFSKNHNTWRCQGDFSRRKYPTLVMTLGLKVFPEDR